MIMGKCDTGPRGVRRAFWKCQGYLYTYNHLRTAALATPHPPPPAAAVQRRLQATQGLRPRTPALPSSRVHVLPSAGATEVPPRPPPPQGGTACLAPPAPGTARRAHRPTAGPHRRAMSLCTATLPRQRATMRVSGAGQRWLPRWLLVSSTRHALASGASLSMTNRSLRWLPGHTA
jgi:hypothetical protein